MIHTTGIQGEKSPIPDLKAGIGTGTETGIKAKTLTEKTLAADRGSKDQKPGIVFSLS